MTEAPVVHSDEEGVRWITLNRPDVLNALGPSHRQTIVELVEGAAASSDVRAVVLTGAGRAFCAGADLSRVAAGPDDDVAAKLRDVQRLMSTILDCPLPIVAAVNGVAAGIGAHLALACDVVLASARARFIEVFARRGLVPDGGGAWLLPRIVGVTRAKELLFFGDDVSAVRAAELGMVTQVIPDDQFEREVRVVVERVAAGPTVAIGLTKRLVNHAFEWDRRTAFEEEIVAVARNRSSDDAAEGLRAFAERRPPQFEGR